MDKTITQMIEEVAEEICNNYCKWPEKASEEGRPDDWLTEDPESPCQNCPLNRLS